MDIETVGFVVGIVGAVLVKASMGDMRNRSARSELEKSLGREPENPALKTFVRGLGLVLAGLGLETYARLFMN
ncbi:MAG TPA: hypothetical protein VIH18_36520 [Candidatus Binatia bacterium]|jgi:hypothetical protein